MYEHILRLHKNVHEAPNNIDSHEESPSKESSEEQPVARTEILPTSISEADLRDKQLGRPPSRASVAIDVVNGEKKEEEDNSACSLM